MYASDAPNHIGCTGGKGLCVMTSSWHVFEDFQQAISHDHDDDFPLEASMIETLVGVKVVSNGAN